MFKKLKRLLKIKEEQLWLERIRTMVLVSFADKYLDKIANKQIEEIIKLK